MKKIFLLLIITHCSLLITYAQYGWYQQNSGTTNNLNQIIYSGNGYWAVGDNGTILESTDNGTTWTQKNSNTTHNLNSISGDIPMLITGDGGTVLKSTNSGDNWFSIYTGVNNNLNGIYNGYARCIVVGDNGIILRSTNSGANWTLVQSTTTNNLMGITSYCIVGSQGTILLSSNGGLSWHQANSGTTKTLYSTTFYYPAMQEGLIVGDSGVILKTIDNGSNWSIINSLTANNLYSITSYSYIWISGQNGLILKTSNNGANWVQFNTGFQNNLNSIYFSDYNTGWAVGDNGLVIHTTVNTWNASERLLDANNISTWFWNDGTFNRNPFTRNAGFEWPKGSNKMARWSSGLLIAAKIQNDTLVDVATYDADYFPGYTDNIGLPQGKNDYNYRMFRLNYGINDSDRQKWPNALLGNSDQGAPVYYDNLTQSWKPNDFADQTMFCSYTDSYPESHMYGPSHSKPLKADVKLVSWSFSNGIEMSNVSYIEYKVINRSTKTWSDVYLGIWSDDDLGVATDDKEGTDTNFQMAYTYNGTNNDPVYGDAPPAVGMVTIVSMARYTGNNNDTLIICEGKIRKIKIGWKQTGMHSEQIFVDDGLEPQSPGQMYRVMYGLTRFGAPLINPITNQPTTFQFSGDPVENTGWLCPSPNDQRFWQGFGPVNMNPGDTQIIVVAQVIARGTSNINSITALRQYAQVAIDNYKNCFENEPIGIVNTQNEVPTRFNLEQNYPNPFNPTTKIKFSIPSVGQRHAFGVHLIIYDILGREVITLINQQLKPGDYEVEWDGSNYASGVYFYKLEAGSFVETKKMVLIK